MAWSDSQLRTFLRAANAAGWNNQQRYVAMKHVGCALTAEGRPSAKHPRNTQGQFELVMALAESGARAAGNGKVFPRPKNGASWAEVARNATDRMVRLVESIAGEAERRLPEKFSRGFLVGFIDRMTRDDDMTFYAFMRPLRLIRECDEGQTYRVLEGLKAWVGRELRAEGLTPESFKPHTGGRPRQRPPRRKEARA